MLHIFSFDRASSSILPVLTVFCKAVTADSGLAAVFFSTFFHYWECLQVVSLTLVFHYPRVGAEQVHSFNFTHRFVSLEIFVVFEFSCAFNCYVFYLSFLCTWSRRDELNVELTPLS